MQGAIEALTYIARNPCSSNEDIQSGIYQYAANILATEGELQYRRNAEMNQKQRQFNGMRNDWDMQNMMKNSDYASMRGGGGMGAGANMFEFDGGPVSGLAQPQQGMARPPMPEMMRGPPSIRNSSGAGFDMSPTATAKDISMGMGMGSSPNMGTSSMGYGMDGGDADIPMGNVATAGGRGSIHMNPMRAESGISGPHIPQSHAVPPAGAQPVMNYPPVPSTNVQAPPMQQSGGRGANTGQQSENTDENGIPIF